MDKQSQKTEKEDKPANRQLGIAGAVSGFVFCLIYTAQFMQDLSNSIAGPEALCLTPFKFGISLFGGFLGGVIIDQISQSINLKRNLAVRILLFLIVMSMGAFIGWYFGARV